MPDYQVRVLSDAGAVIERRVSAADAQAVAVVLGVAPARVLAVQPRQAAAAEAGASRQFPLRLFSQELSVLLRAGIPLLEALVTLREKEQSDAVAQVLAAVIDALRQGLPLSAALRVCANAFDPLFIAVIESSERTGQIAEALAEQARYLQWIDQLRSRLIGAAIYPAMLIVASSVVVLFVLTFVVPRFATLIEENGGDMPAASRALLALGAVTGAHPALTLAVGLSLLALPVLALRLPAVRAAVIEPMWRLPGIGPRLRLLALAQFYRTAGMLLTAGVPALPALKSCRAVVAWPLRASLDAAIAAVGRGERLSAALEQQALATPVALRMVRVGERSGELAQMLSQAAAFYDDELSRLSEFVTRLVNPLLMLVMGGVIGGVVVLMYLPIFQLAEQVQ